MQWIPDNDKSKQGMYVVNVLPALTALDHDGSMTTTIAIVLRTILFDIPVLVGTPSKHRVGLHPHPSFHGLVPTLQYALEYARLLGSIESAGLGGAGFGVYEGVDVIGGFGR